MENRDYFDTVYQTKDIIRMTLLVAYSDGTLDPQEYEKAIEVYSELSDEYLGEHDSSVLIGQVERISEGLSDEVEGLAPEEIHSLALETAERIEDSTSQEVALVSAMRIAYGDFELDKHESRCITEIANNWGISIKNLI